VTTLATVPDPGFAPLAPARRRFVQRAISDGLRIGLATVYMDGSAELMRGAGATWFPMRRVWVGLVSQKQALLDGLARMAPRYPAWSFEDACAVVTSACVAPQQDYFTELLDVQILPLRGGGCAVASAFDPLVVQALRGLSGRFHKPAQAWEVRHSPAAVLDALRSIAGVDPVLVFVHDTAATLEDLGAAVRAACPIKVAAAPPPEHGGADGERQGSGFLSTFGTPLQRLAVDEVELARTAQACGLRPYQVDGVRHLLGLSSALLADDMGLGKTRQAIVAARMAAGAHLVLVTCPASLGLNWEREIRAVYPQSKVTFIGTHDIRIVAGADWVISNYERLGALVRASTIAIGAMVVDEAHYLKEHQAGRTRNAFLLAERVPRCFLLTGTPVLNREIEVHTLLRLSGHPIGALPLADFRRAYAGNPARRTELADRLSQWMLRRGKDVLTDLGEKLQQVRVIQPADGLAGYKRIMGDGELQAMPKITLLRQHLESLKVDFLIESIQCLAEGDKALIFCEYMDTVEALRQAFAALGIGCVTLVGADTPKRRMAAVDAFQGDVNVKVFIGTTQAAGVGITLTAANYVFFASMPWTPALKRQAEDRAYRSGQRRNVLVITPIVAETIDEQIVGLLEAKREIEVSVIESSRRRITGVGETAASLRQPRGAEALRE
jgi:superfamily II DNA or RNA helicase